MKRITDKHIENFKSYLQNEERASATVEKYMREIPEFRFRMKVKGGLTGYAQVYGKYNTSAYDKLRLDLMYIEKYSLFLDIKLILMTVQTMFKRESTEGFDKGLGYDLEAAATLEKNR